ncbi:hypothetical protein GIB67_022945 [Kingdonia uniflora]|uniref:NAD(+) ADP-ribosyltransferase n=1 Tax=Kingdonia uniflora TaxID=39325 RepID=A0A7J7P2A9_9MAGN|nr:hypothetical protein GIB67_022945 [Kingdonia uniflora]
MASNLKVDEIQSQIAQRGIEILGTKPTLVKRLELALEEETKQRQFVKFSAMGIRQLREQASLVGISSSGSKKELVERVCAHFEKDNEGICEEAVDECSSNEELVMDTVIVAVNKYKVEELRTELAQRGLDVSGTKAVLIRRLEAALRKETELKSSSNTTDGTTGKKRSREEKIEDSNVPEKFKSLERFREMGVRQLREEAILLGISSNGTKKELLERLSAEPNNDHQARENVDETTKEKLVTGTKKGGTVLDQWLADHVKAQYHVLQHGDEIYDAMLNQTNVGENNNKFYVIQALESDDGGTFMVYNRWGRVGVKGQDKLQGPYTSRDSAIQEFELKFYAKTKNQWSDRKKFVCLPRCYVWLEMDYNGPEKDLSVPEKLNNSIMAVQPRETQLEPRVAKFISLICNISMMRQQMLEIGYNAEKLPLGKLSKSTILKGYDVLKRIADIIGQSNRKQFEQLSGEFYTVIPHDFGFKKMREFVIDTPNKLKCKLEMVSPFIFAIC